MHRYLCGTGDEIAVSAVVLTCAVALPCPDWASRGLPSDHPSAQPNVTFWERFFWFPVSPDLYHYCCRSQLSRSICTSPVLLRSMRTETLSAGLTIAFPTVSMELGPYIFPEWRKVIVCGCLLLFFDFHFYLLGGFCALPPARRPWFHSLCWCRLCCNKMRTYWLIYMNIQRWDWLQVGWICVLSDVPRNCPLHFWD